MLVRLLYCVLFLITSIGYAQGDKSYEQKNGKTPKKEVAKIDAYKIISLTRDTIHADTSLTIKKDYRFNYLRKDLFGLLPFANEGQTYNTLYFGLNNYSYAPEFGFRAKHFNYLEANQIKYYHVPTPYTELYYRSVMEQGQTIDAFITLNTSKNLNFSIAYKGLRSVGKYINALSSTGNFRVTTSYKTTNKRYIANAHIVYQDIYNAENGGIKSTTDFESGNSDFNDRARLDVNLKDANTKLEGNRYFLDHTFRLNKEETANTFYLNHQISIDSKYFQYNQTSQNSFFGNAYLSSQISDRTNFNQLKNQLALSFSNKTLGTIRAFTENLSYNYYYNKVYYKQGQTTPNKLNGDLWFAGAQYKITQNKINGMVQYTNGITNSSLGQLDVLLSYKVDNKNNIAFTYQKINKQPNHIYNLYQSSYLNYNWNNSFTTEKFNKLALQLNSNLVKASAEYQTIQDYLYFSNDASDTSLLITPKQYNQTINCFTAKLEKEFKVKKWALDNTVLYQNVKQNQHILNLPDLVIRNTLYYSNSFFKKALYMQMGVTSNYFTSYYSDNYNPIIGEFYVQQQKKIGNFPVLDVFANAKIKTALIFLKLEHINSSFSSDNYYATPSNPYRDFIIRFGITWTFFN